MIKVSFDFMLHMIAECQEEGPRAKMNIQQACLSKNLEVQSINCAKNIPSFIVSFFHL